MIITKSTSAQLTLTSDASQIAYRTSGMMFTYMRFQQRDKPCVAFSILDDRKIHVISYAAYKSKYSYTDKVITFNKQIIQIRDGKKGEGRKAK